MPFRTVQSGPVGDFEHVRFLITLRLVSRAGCRHLARATHASIRGFVGGCGGDSTPALPAETVQICVHHVIDTNSAKGRPTEMTVCWWKHAASAAVVVVNRRLSVFAFAAHSSNTRRAEGGRLNRQAAAEAVCSLVRLSMRPSSSSRRRIRRRGGKFRFANFCILFFIASFATPLRSAGAPRSTIRIRAPSVCPRLASAVRSRCESFVRWGEGEMRHREERVRSETTLTHKRNLRILCIFIYGFWCSYRDGDGSQPAAYVRIFFAFAARRCVSVSVCVPLG